MAQGAATRVAEKHAAGEIDGIISLGGSAGTTIGTTAMQAVPVGVPKIMVSTLASGDTSPYVQSKDISMMYSVVDIAGINRLSRQILANAAGAIVRDGERRGTRSDSRQAAHCSDNVRRDNPVRHKSARSP